MMTTPSLIERLEALEAPCFAIEQEIGRLKNPNATRLSVFPAYTASLDAAMTHAKGKPVRLLITEDGIGSALVDGTEGTAFNAATAIIIASLKAQEASNATSP